MRSSFWRIVAVMSVLALLTSRVMLLAHEFGGHGAPAVAFGGRITGYYLFLFAGGRVSYEIVAPTLAQRLVIGLGGIALELVVGVLAFAAAHRWKHHPLAAFVLSCVGTMVAGHAAIYLARGVHYGYGDGTTLSRLLGGQRWMVVLPATAFAGAVAYFGARQWARLPARELAGSPGRGMALVCLAALSAGMVHGVLAWAETRYFPDPVWVGIMEDAAATEAKAELQRRLAEAERAGAPPPAAEERERMLQTLEKERRPWPLDPLLAAALLTGLVLGVRRGVRSEALDPSTPSFGFRTVASAGAALAAMLVIILVLRLLRDGPH